jgi:hypothetical protein
MSEKKPCILFISHDSSLTGAPVLLINLLKLLSKSSLFNIRILLYRGGILEDEFKAIAPTFVLKKGNYRKKSLFLLNAIDYLVYRSKIFFLPILNVPRISFSTIPS